MQPLNLTVDEACRVLGIKRTLAYELLGKGKLSAVKCGNRTLIRVASIEAYSASLPKAVFQPVTA